MNIKKKIMKLIRSKVSIVIFIIIIFLVIYFYIEKHIVKNNNTNEYDYTDNIVYDDFMENRNSQENVDENKEELKKEQVIEEKGNKDNMYIYITGEVNEPGVYILKEGSRISDAINIAGGTTQNANLDKINLVYLLKDGMKINIPNNLDLKNNPNYIYITMSSGDEKNDSDLINKDDNINNNSNNVSAFKVSMVNINTATQTELETLPGIGPSLALKIINYRKENGKFENIEELKNVSGIGDNKYDEIKEYIYI